jgi:hypothetical protein
LKSNYKVQSKLIIMLFWVFLIFLVLIAFRNITFTAALIFSGTVGFICGAIFTVIGHRKAQEKEDEVLFLVSGLFILLSIIVIPSVFLHLAESIAKLILIFLAFFALLPTVQATFLTFHHNLDFLQKT